MRKELQHIRLAHEQCGATVAAKDAQIEELQTLRKMQLYKLQGARECISSLTKQVEEARTQQEAGAAAAGAPGAADGTLRACCLNTAWG